MITINHKGLLIKMDDADYEQFKDSFWVSFHKARNKHYLYHKNTYLGLAKIMLETDRKVQYADGDTLNLTRENLIFASPERSKRLKKEWSIKNKDKCVAKATKWNKDNIEKFRSSVKKSALKHKDKRHARRKEYLKDPTVKRKVNDQAKLRSLKVEYKFARLNTRGTWNNRKVSISLEQYKELINKGCIYCSKALCDETGYSLDRISNEQSYTVENVVPCCKNCNRMKNNLLTVDETTKVVELLQVLRGKTLIWK